MLTDLEYRVWTQYLLSADDFGVMRATPLAFQNDNDYLANRRAKELQRCIDALVGSGLVRRFEHQGKPYLYQHDWQRWQKVEYPRATNNPLPEDVSQCDEGTLLLFAKHPGGQRKDRRHADDDPNHSERAFRIHPEGVPPTRAGAPAKRLTANANGTRLEADGEPLDVAFRAFQEAYPAARRKGGYLVEQWFMAAVVNAGSSVALMAALENHKRSEQWADAKLIPGMDTWLNEERWRQELPAKPVDAQRAERLAKWKALEAKASQGRV